jgi:hypothetical protein
MISTNSFHGAYILVWFLKKRLLHDRTSVSRAHLQSAISEAVRKAEPDCEGFVGVIIERETPKTRFDANWTVRGVKYGKADRGKSNKAIETIVPRMQREFLLSEAVKGAKPDVE